MIETIIGFDPGKRTGIAFYHPNHNWTNEVPYGKDLFIELNVLTNYGLAQNALIVVEDYIITSGRNVTHSREPLKVIGIIEERFKDHEIVIMPSAKKEYASDQMLKAHDVYKSGLPHGNDAMRHIVTWATENKHRCSREIRDWINQSQLKFLEVV